MITMQRMGLIIEVEEEEREHYEAFGWEVVKQQKQTRGKAKEAEKAEDAEE